VATLMREMAASGPASMGEEWRGEDMGEEWRGMAASGPARFDLGAKGGHAMVKVPRGAGSSEVQLLEGGPSDGEGGGR
jgi:hypothetical protein